MPAATIAPTSVNAAASAPIARRRAGGLCSERGETRGAARVPLGPSAAGAAVAAARGVGRRDAVAAAVRRERPLARPGPPGRTGVAVPAAFPDLGGAASSVAVPPPAPDPD